MSKFELCKVCMLQASTKTNRKITNPYLLMTFDIHIVLFCVFKVLHTVSN